jgi:hypothetical protein
MNHRTSILAAAALVALAACSSTIDVPAPRPFAFLDLNTLSAASRSTGYVAKGTALFTQARITGIIGSADLQERCDQPTKIVPTLARTTTPFEPGTVTLSFHGPADPTTRTVPLLPKLTGEGDTYWTNDSLPNMTPANDSVTFAATGAAGGFPAFSLRAPTVAPYTPQAVDDSVTGVGIRVQWTPSPNPASAMQISLQYDSTFTSNFPNAEIVCIARDDGDFTINRVYLEPGLEAGVDSSNVHRQVAFSRFLTTTTQVGDAIVTVVVRRDTTLVKH